MLAPAQPVIRFIRHRILVTVIAAGLLTLTAQPALAHVDLAASDPADGSLLDTPVETIKAAWEKRKHRSEVQRHRFFLLHETEKRLAR